MPATIEATSNESFQCHLNFFFFLINSTYCKFVPIYAHRSDFSPPTASSRLACSSRHPVHNAISARTHYAHARRYTRVAAALHRCDVRAEKRVHRRRIDWLAACTGGPTSTTSRRATVVNRRVERRPGAGTTVRKPEKTAVKSVAVR